MDATDVLFAIDESANPRDDAGLLAGVPRGLAEALIIEADQDAVRVATYLDGFMAQLAADYPGETSHLNWRTIFSVKTLLELAAALRILEWEQKGLVRECMELPSANDAIVNVLLNANKDELQGNLSLRLVRIFAENFAWSSMRDMGAHLLLDEIVSDDERAVDYISRLLLKIVRAERENE